MKALLSTKTEHGIESQITDVPKPACGLNQVIIRSEFSSINYKDALAVTGRGAIFKKLPLIGGIDVAGTVAESRSDKFNAGDRVLVTGCGLGETHNGGYAEFVVEDTENVIALPAALKSEEAMIYGTAGFTAALCVERLLHNEQTPSLGPMVVTGASGGVGQFAIYFLSRLGFEVIAVSSKANCHSQLLSLGAKKVFLPQDLELGSRPLENVRFGGAIDNVGGAILSRILAHTQLWGNVASVGLAASAELHTTVMPHILRGVSLIGISSNNTPRPLREKIWQRLSGDLKPKELRSFVTEVVTLEQVLNTAQKMLAQKTQGRYVVKYN